MKRTALLRSRGGFTITELLLTLGILGILLALAAPSLTGMLRVNRTDGLINRMTADITRARLEAVRAGRTVSFEIYDSGKRYRVVRSGLNGAPADTVTRTNIATEFVGVTVTPATLTFSFDSRGLVSSNNGSTTVEATAGSQKSKLEISSVGTVYRENY